MRAEIIGRKGKDQVGKVVRHLVRSLKKIKSQTTTEGEDLIYRYQEVGLQLDELREVLEWERSIKKKLHLAESLRRDTTRLKVLRPSRNEKGACH